MLRGSPSWPPHRLPPHACPEQDDKGDELLHALGIVLGHEADQSISVSFRLSDDSQAGSERGQARVRAMRAVLAKEGSQWWVLKLSNMSTILREWGAVHAISHLPLREVLLSAKVCVSGTAQPLPSTVLP